MCCFSGPVDKVEGTKIFARMVAPARQALVYQMQVTARADLAMVLPLPVPARSAEDAVTFVSLEGYPQFFDHLEVAFPQPQSFAYRGGPVSGAVPKPAPLAVHHVGDFVASFVPSPSDLDRLDPRFRLPSATFDEVPDYADWGFAVFQLAGLSATVAAKAHPMAFTFPTRRPDALFFPTLHVHDRRVHATAPFDHVLYAQGAPATGQWFLSAGPLSRYADPARAQGLIDRDAEGCRQRILGERDNRDVWLRV